MAKERDIFGGTNTGLINAGKQAVKIAKDHQAEKKRYAKKEIEHAVKHDLCDRMRSKFVSKTTMLLPDMTPKKKKVDPEAGIFAACRKAWDKWGKGNRHAECSGENSHSKEKCICACHKGAK